MTNFFTDSEFDIEKMCKNYPNDEYQKFKGEIKQRKNARKILYLSYLYKTFNNDIEKMCK